MLKVLNYFFYRKASSRMVNALSLIKLYTFNEHIVVTFEVVSNEEGSFYS